MGQYRQSFHPDLPTTRLWGYADATNGLPKWSYLGASIVAMKGTPVRVNFVNLLPPVHPLPVDHTIPGAETGQNVNRAVAHLHGGFVVWPSDGGPFHWSTPLLQHGPSWVRWLPNRVGIKTDDALLVEPADRPRSCGITTTRSASHVSTPTPGSPRATS